jgi:diacylglycerol kinase family enzyme
VLINPVGGTGNAQHVYDTIVSLVLERSAIETEVIVTQYQAHATEIAMKLSLDQYDCIIAVGGDGLLSESASLSLSLLLSMVTDCVLQSCRD